VLQKRRRGEAHACIRLSRVRQQGCAKCHAGQHIQRGAQAHAAEPGATRDHVLQHAQARSDLSRDGGHARRAGQPGGRREQTALRCSDGAYCRRGKRQRRQWRRRRLPLHNTHVRG
jgi:hypothetical protein